MVHRTCSIEGCANPVVSWGWCHKHYVRWRRHGDPLTTKQPKRDGYTEEWARSMVAVAESGCWDWQGALDANGYGVVSGSFRAHQLMHRIYIGEVPDGLEIDHLCRNRRCCNPGHLEAVTHAENLRRAAAARSKATHCINGHQWTEANTRMTPDGSRRCCRGCERERAARQRQAQKTKAKENTE